MYKQISELEKEHKSFRRKIAQLELGSNVHVLTTTIPVEKRIDFYTKKSIHHSMNIFKIHIFLSMIIF